VSEQLALGVEAAVERRYTCCGMPCGPLPPSLMAPEGAARARELAAIPRPHAGDCPNPVVGTWIDRATGWPIRRLGCFSVGGERPCPYGGRFPQRSGTVDPYDGECCLTLRRKESS
jgi:hypothetical protein